MKKDALIDIEITLAHQEQQITELNAVINDQWAEIDALKSKLDKVLRKLDALENTDGADQSDNIDTIDHARQNIPPHY